MRKILLAIIILIIIFVIGGLWLGISESVFRLTTLTKYLALTAAGSLYLSLVSCPMEDFGRYGKNNLRIWRNSWAFLALLLGMTHGTVAFFGQLGGFSGWSFLPDSYIKPVILGFFVLLLFITGSGAILIKNSRWQIWRILGYIASVFMIWHVLLIGTHFVSTTSWASRAGFMLLSLLLILQAAAIDHRLSKVKGFKGLGWVTVVVLVILVAIGVWMNIPNGTNQNLSIHSSHLNQNVVSQAANRRFSVSFNAPDIVNSQKETILNWKVYDANTGTQITQFLNVYEKKIHLIVVDEELKYFAHLHPEFDQVSGFNIKTTFPHDGRYRLYVDFTPFGESVEQQFGFSLQVGNASSSSVPKNDIDNQSKKFGEYDIEWGSNGQLSADKLNNGQQRIVFKFTKKGQELKSLQPYLGAFGHLIMINTQTFQYVHVHPIQLARLNETDRSGPEVEFMPMGVNGSIVPGTYKMFGQFNPDGQLLVTDFIVRIDK